MSEHITDVEIWKNKYSFLNNVWKTYVEFDNTVTGDTNYHRYLGVCDLFVKHYGEGKIMLNDFCMKLVRNLGHYDVTSSFFNPSHARCHILYNWIYNTIENSEIPDELIIKCFEDYTDQINKMQMTPKCSYDLFNRTYLEPRKITILKIFDDNISDIIAKLKEEYSSNDSLSQKYVCECVNIYKEMYRNYCNDQKARDTKHEKTCDMLDKFKTSYMQYFYTILDQNDKIPSLVNVEDEYKRKCQKNQSMPVLTSSEVDIASDSTRFGTTVTEYPGTSRRSDVINYGDRTNSLSPTVSTTLGTVAGVSSLLAFLYKFTPAKRLIHSGFGGNRIRINSNLYAEGPNELLCDGLGHENLNSYNIGYEAAYEP